jgi:hypothetical protein
VLGWCKREAVVLYIVCFLLSVVCRVASIALITVFCFRHDDLNGTAILLKNNQKHQV